jgi:hypothetical protein
MKGGVYSKGAKAIRECETPIITKKEALALKGVGKGMAGKLSIKRSYSQLLELL